MFSQVNWQGSRYKTCLNMLPCRLCCVHVYCTIQENIHTPNGRLLEIPKGAVEPLKGAGGSNQKNFPGGMDISLNHANIDIPQISVNVMLNSFLLVHSNYFPGFAKTKYIKNLTFG